MYSKKLEKLARQKLSEQERNKNKERRAANRRKNTPPSADVNVDGWHVYTRLYPHHFNIFIWVFIVLTLGFCSFIVYWLGPRSKWLLISGIVLTGAFLLRWGIYWLLKVLRYRNFKTWRSRLPFKLKGWDAVWKNNEFDGFKKWYKSMVVSVETDSSLSDLSNSIKNALIVFRAEANKCFYAPNFVQSGFVGDIRKKWSVTGNVEATGSANQTVLGELYVLIDQHLRLLHEELGGIQSVEISIEGNICSVDPVEFSSD